MRFLLPILFTTKKRTRPTKDAISGGAERSPAAQPARAPPWSLPHANASGRGRPPAWFPLPAGLQSCRFTSRIRGKEVDLINDMEVQWKVRKTLVSDDSCSTASFQLPCCARIHYHSSPGAIIRQSGILWYILMVGISSGKCKVILCNS